MKKNLTFESAMQRIEEIAELLESGKASLEETVALFEEANGLFAFCTERLSHAEEKLYLISKKQNGFKLELEENR